MQLAIAAEVWKKADVRVTFEWVHLPKDAAFVLSHAGKGGRTLVMAFFPNPADLNSKVFTHELGHVLGLRYEFAIDGIKAEKQGAARLGERDPKRVMTSSPELLEMQQYDIESAKTFYALRPDANGNPPKVGFTKVVDYVSQ
ncbi:hypothetical protein FSOLCH5_001803 [Fusarium solani]